MTGYDNYDIQDVDPYLLPGSTCLDNLLGISDTGALNKAEAEIVEIAISELILAPVNPTFDLDHLCGIHRHLFSDVYAWAGEIRTTEIGKGGLLFLPYQRINQMAEEIFTALHQEQLLAGLDKLAFADRAAVYLGRINTLHAFREGNGRIQRIFLDQLADRYGYLFEWAAISGEQMANACREARMPDPSTQRLQRLLRLNILTVEEACSRDSNNPN